VGAGEIRVTVLGSGDPFVKKSQASASLLIEESTPDDPPAWWTDALITD
jgi:ribonuclease Z